MKTKIENVYTDSWGQIKGTHKGRKVQWTYSVNMWFYQDTGQYIYPPYERA